MALWLATLRTRETGILIGPFNQTLVNLENEDYCPIKNAASYVRTELGHFKLLN